MKTKDFIIEKVTAFIHVDPQDNSEGIVAMLGTAGWQPLVGSYPEIIELMEKNAREIARASHKEIKMVEFSTRTEIKVIR